MDRITSHIEEKENGCWIWLGSCSRGAPQIRLSNPRRLAPARRYCYETHNGVIVPKTHNIVSTCKDRKCVSPFHLVAVPIGEYKLGMRKIEHCQRGHEFSEWNTGCNESRGNRFCIKCDKDHAREYMATRRVELPEYLKDLRLTRRWERQQFVNQIKSNLGCMLCKEVDPVCLDFHHTNPNNKKASISSLATNGASEKSILAEIAKCELLCSNCHRKHHARQREELD